MSFDAECNLMRDEVIETFGVSITLVTAASEGAFNTSTGKRTLTSAAETVVSAQRSSDNVFQAGNGQGRVMQRSWIIKASDLPSGEVRNVKDGSGADEQIFKVIRWAAEVDRKLVKIVGERRV